MSSKLLTQQERYKELEAVKEDELEKEEEANETAVKRIVGEKLIRLGIEKLGKLKPVGKLQHIFSHIHMTYVVYTVDAVKEEKEFKPDSESDNNDNIDTDQVQWLSREELATCGTSTGMRKVFDLATGASQQNSKGQVKRKRVDDSDGLKQKSISSFFVKKNAKN